MIEKLAVLQKHASDDRIFGTAWNLAQTINEYLRLPINLGAEWYLLNLCFGLHLS
jgi:hypothetical protein